MATVLETFGVIRADGTLELEEKLSLLPGRVKVHVESAEPDSDAAFAKQFEALVTTWKERTGYSSKMKTKSEHPAFRAIVAMGERAVPLILADLEKNGGFGFLALEEITGFDPLPGETHVTNNQVANAWIVWGRAKGYRWEHAV